jgi:hypothetical protein
MAKITGAFRDCAKAPKKGQGFLFCRFLYENVVKNRSSSYGRTVFMWECGEE